LRIPARKLATKRRTQGESVGRVRRGVHILAAMPADLGRLRLERFQAEVTYHAVWTFGGLKGILGESWAHGPTFGAFSEVGRGQVNLTPAEDVQDRRITAVAGLRASGLLAEGSRTAEAAAVSQAWLRDVLELLKPRRVVGLKLELFGLYPIRNPDIVTNRLIKQYFQEDELRRVAGLGDRPTYTALDLFAPPEDENPGISLVLGVVGPPHMGTFFNDPDPERDRAWWMGLRLSYILALDAGVRDPLDRLASMISEGQHELARIGAMTLPSLVE
jgi:hypothetical protein